MKSDLTSKIIAREDSITPILVVKTCWIVSCACPVIGALEPLLLLLTAYA